MSGESMTRDQIEALLKNEIDSGIRVTTTPLDGGIVVTIKLSTDFQLDTVMTAAEVKTGLKAHLIKVQNQLHSIVSGM